MQYRFYSFINYYLSSIQQGIQTAHLISEIYKKYVDLGHSNGLGQKNELDIFDEWAYNDKTIIVLNGGNNKKLNDTYEMLNSYLDTFNLPYAKFNEDKDSLDSALTGFGCIVPIEFYDDSYNSHYIEYINNGNTVESSLLNRIEIYKMLKSHQLAK